MIIILIGLIGGVRKLSGENLKVVSAEFSTLSWAVFMFFFIDEQVLSTHAAASRVEDSAQVLSC